MTCASCGKQNPTGVRHCIHCGAEQSVPTPIAAVAAAASLSRASRVPAANAAQVEPRDPAAVDAANQASATAEDSDSATTATGGAGASPAYAAGPNRRRLAVGLIAACIVVAIAIAMVVAWRMQGNGLWVAGHEAIDRGVGAPGSTLVPTSEAPAAAEGVASEAPPAPIPSRGLGAPEPTGNAATALSTAAPASVTSSGREPPVEIQSLPPRPAPARAPRRAAVEKEVKAVPVAPASTPQMPPTPIKRAAASAAVSTAAAATGADHWRRMEEEASHCTREDFIARVVCGQRVRFRYCDGYWGKVTQCPANPAPERGQ